MMGEEGGVFAEEGWMLLLCLGEGQAKLDSFEDAIEIMFKP